MPRLMNRSCHRGMATLVVAVGIWAAPDQALAQEVENRPWSEILIVVGRNIALSLPDGTLEGKATAVTANTLELDVQTTSNRNAYPPGHTTIARPLVSSIRMRKSDGRAPRVASQTIGQAAALGGLYGLGMRNGGLRGMLQGAGVQIGAATAGAAIGRKLDDREIETVIRIVAEPMDADSRSRPVAQATSRPLSGRSRRRSAPSCTPMRSIMRQEQIAHRRLAAIDDAAARS